MISAIQSTAIQIDNNEQDLHFFNAPSTQQAQLLADFSSPSSFSSPPDYQTSKFLSNTGKEKSSQNAEKITPSTAVKNSSPQDAETPQQHVDNIELENFTDKSKFSEKREQQNFSPSDWHNKESFLINGPYRKNENQAEEKRQNPQTTRVKLQFWPNAYETHLRGFDDVKNLKNGEKGDKGEKVGKGEKGEKGEKLEKGQKPRNRDTDSDSGRNSSSGTDELEDDEKVGDAKLNMPQASKTQENAEELSIKQKILNLRPVLTQKFESVQTYLKTGKKQFPMPFMNDKHICSPKLPVKPKSSTYYIAWNECKIIEDSEKLNNQHSVKSKLGELSEEIAKEHIDRQLKTELSLDLERNLDRNLDRNNNREQTPIHQTSTVQFDALEARSSSRINSSKFSTTNLQSENSRFTDVTYINDDEEENNNNDNDDNISEKSQSSQKTETSHKSQNSVHSQARSQANSALNTSPKSKTLQNSQSSNKLSPPKVDKNVDFDRNFNPSAMPQPQPGEQQSAEPVAPKSPMIEVKLSPARLEFYEKEKSAKAVSEECTLESADNNNVKEFIDFTRIWHVYKRDNNVYEKVKEPKEGLWSKRMNKKQLRKNERRALNNGQFFQKPDSLVETVPVESDKTGENMSEEATPTVDQKRAKTTKSGANSKKKSKSVDLSFLCGLGIGKSQKIKANSEKKKLLTPDSTQDPSDQKSAHRNNSVSSGSSDSAQSSISPKRSEKDSGIHDPENDPETDDTQEQIQSLPPVQKCNQYNAQPCKEAAFTIEVFSDEGFYSLAFVDSITRNNWFEMIESKLNDIRQEKTFNFYETKDSKKQLSKFTLPWHIATRPNYNYHAIYKVNINDFEHAFTEIPRGNQKESRILPADIFQEVYGFKKQCGSANHGRFCNKRDWKTYEGVYWVALESKNLHIINPRYNGQTVKFTGNDKNLNFVESEMSESICAIIPFDYGICVSRCGRDSKRPYVVLNYKISTPYEHMKTKMFFPSPGCMDNPDLATCGENDTTYLRMRLFTDTWDQMLNFHFDLLEWKNRQVASAQVTLEPSMGRRVKEQYHVDLYKNDGQFRHEYKARKAKKINYVELPEETKKNLKQYRNDNAYIINRHTSSPEIFPGDHGKEYKSRSKGAKAMRVKAWNRREFDDLTAADLSAYMLTDFSAIENPQARTALKKICLLERRAEIEEFWRKERSIYEPCDLLNFVKQIPGEAAEEVAGQMQDEINRKNKIKSGSLIDDSEPSKSTKITKTQLIKPNADTQDYIRASGLRKCLKSTTSVKQVSVTPKVSLSSDSRVDSKVDSRGDSRADSKLDSKLDSQLNLTVNSTVNSRVHSRAPSHNSSVFISNKASNEVKNEFNSFLNDDGVQSEQVSGDIYQNIVINDTHVHDQGTFQQNNNQQTNEDANCQTMTTNITTVESTSSISTPIPVANVKSFNFITDEKVGKHNTNPNHLDFNQNHSLEPDSGVKSDQFKSGDYIVSGMMH